MQQEEILSSYPWMNNDLFERIIKKDYPNSTVEVKNFSVKSALALGENYGSIMVRATVQYKIDGDNNVEKRFIIKAGHLKEEVRAMTSEMNFFENEIKMFRDILPEMTKLLRNIGDDTEFSAKYYEVNEEKSYLVLEDLTVRDYRNVDKRLGLNHDQFKQSITKIAKYHACTATMLEQNYNFGSMHTSLLTGNVIKQMLENSLLAISELVKQKPEFAHLSDKLRKLSSTIMDKIKDTIKRKKSDFTVLVHGDLWMNNVMYKFDESGAAIDAILLDYQAPFVGPAVLDIANHMFTSLPEDFRDRDIDLVIQHYHSVLQDTLIKLNYPNPIPTLTEIQVQFLEKSICYSAFSAVVPGVRLFENKGEDMTDLVGENDGIKTMLRIISTPAAQKMIEFGLDYGNRKGYFD